MSRAEGWGFVTLMMGLLTVTMSLLFGTGMEQTFGCIVGTLLCILSGGLYALSAGSRSDVCTEHPATSNQSRP